MLSRFLNLTFFLIYFTVLNTNQANLLTRIIRSIEGSSNWANNNPTFDSEWIRPYEFQPSNWSQIFNVKPRWNLNSEFPERNLSHGFHHFQPWNWTQIFSDSDPWRQFHPPRPRFMPEHHNWPQWHGCVCPCLDPCGGKPPNKNETSTEKPREKPTNDSTPWGPEIPDMNDTSPSAQLSDPWKPRWNLNQEFPLNRNNSHGFQYFQPWNWTQMFNYSDPWRQFHQPRQLRPRFMPENPNWPQWHRCGCPCLVPCGGKPPNKNETSTVKPTEKPINDSTPWGPEIPDMEDSSPAAQISDPWKPRWSLNPELPHNRGISNEFPRFRTWNWTNIFNDFHEPRPFRPRFMPENHNWPRWHGCGCPCLVSCGGKPNKTETSTEKPTENRVNDSTPWGPEIPDMDDSIPPTQ